MNARSILLLVAGILVGLGLGCALAPEGTVGPQSVAGTQPPGAVIVPEAGAQAPDLVSDGVTERRASSATNGTLVPNIPRGAIDAAVERAPAPANFEPAGSGTVTGRVVDVDGEPLAGVRVVGSAYGETQSTRERLVSQPPSMVLRSLEDVLDSQAELWAELHAQLAVATSGADGRFVLEGLSESRSLSVRAYLDGYMVRRPQQVTANGPELTLLARRIVPVSFNVVDSSGAVVEQAQLFIAQENDKELVEWSPTAEPLLLFEGRNRVRAARGVLEDARWNLDEIQLYAETVSDEVAIDVRPGMERIDLALPEARALVVRFEAAEPLPPNFDATIVLQERGKERNGWGRRLSVRGSTERVAFGSVDSGVYDVELQLNGIGEVIASMEVDYAGGLHEIVLHIPALEQPTVFRVRVAGPDGEWLEEMDFRYAVREGNSSSRSGMRSTWLGEGWHDVRKASAYRVRESEAAVPSDALEYLMATHKIHGALETPIEEGRTEYEFAYDPAGSLDVSVSGWDPDGGKGTVMLKPIAEDDPSGPFGRGGGMSVGSRGTCFFPSVPIGRYEAVLTVNQQQLARVELSISAGANALTLVPEARYEVVVDCPNFPPGTQVRLEPSDREDGMWSNLSAETGEDGVAVIEGVVAGAYHLQAGLHMETVDVPCARILVDAALPNAARISVYEDDGAFAQLGFEHEDLIVGADGVLFADIEELGRAFQQLGSQAVTLLIERGGERIDLVTAIVEGWELALQNPGGSIAYETRD